MCNCKIYSSYAGGVCQVGQLVVLDQREYDSKKFFSHGVVYICIYQISLSTSLPLVIGRLLVWVRFPPEALLELVSYTTLSFVKSRVMR